MLFYNASNESKDSEKIQESLEILNMANQPIADIFHRRIQSTLTDRALSFIEIGVACNAITVLDQAGVVEKLLITGHLKAKDLRKFSENPRVLIESALKTLCHVEVLSKKGTSYILSDLGYEICSSMPLINMLFVGYGNLFSKQNEIFSGTKSPDYYDLDNEAISKGCSGLPVLDLETELCNFIQRVGPRGIICDLGCGAGHRLIELHKLLGVRGLGIDLCKESIKEANKLVKENPMLNFIVSDVRKLKCVWEEVEILMQCFMTHDISPKKAFLDTLYSYKRALPNMKYFIVLDVFSSDSSEKNKKFAPGFDYIHGLQGISTRNHDETIDLFIEAGYAVELDIRSKTFPNTCLWILKPSTKS